MRATEPTSPRDAVGDVEHLFPRRGERQPEEVDDGCPEPLRLGDRTRHELIEGPDAVVGHEALDVGGPVERRLPDDVVRQRSSTSPERAEQKGDVAGTRAVWPMHPMRQTLPAKAPSPPPISMP